MLLARHFITLRRPLLMSALAFALILLLAEVALPQNDRPVPIRVTSVTLRAMPARYTGACPGVIKFEGSITLSGAGTVRYTWLRSDGATAPVSSLTFPRAGTQRVETTWTLGGAELPRYSGWEALKVLEPNQVTSARAPFVLTCAQPQIFKVTAVTVAASPAQYTGPCPGVIRFTGSITATGAGVVRYTWLRSDNASAPTSTLTFDGAGTKTVDTTWTLGGAALPRYAGWEAIKIIAPNPITSGRALFKLTCANPNPSASVDLTVGKGIIRIGDKAATNGGTMTLTPADSFLTSGGKCAFNVSYDVVAYGSGPRTPIFANRLRADSEVVSQQTNVSVIPGRSELIRTQAYLPAGRHTLTLTVDDGGVVHESNEGNNTVKIQVIVQCPAGRPRN